MSKLETTSDEIVKQLLNVFIIILQIVGPKPLNLNIL